jgi:Carboxypeptidase regulatory-like domain
MKPRWILPLFLLIGLPLFAQTSGLRGRVTDASGALVPGARVTISGPAGFTRTALAGNDGGYVFADLPSGSYTVQASAPQLVLAPVKVSLKAGQQQFNLQLRVASAKQELTVQENGGPAVSTEATGNASALVLTGSDLDALSDNPDDLAADLQALAGPSAGPNGGSIFIDGFSGGQLPPKDAIREIRINQNPFSAEYDKLGFGRIEIFTKPGSDKFRGLFQYNFANDIWNSRNPYAARKAPLHLNELEGNISGPLSRRASFYFSWQKEWVDNGSIINGVTLDPQTLAISPFNGFFVTPQGPHRSEPARRLSAER